MPEHPAFNYGYHSPVRIVTIVLFCLGLLFQSHADAALPQHPCPMEAQATWNMADGMDDGCCNDAATALATGMLCKTDVPCASTSVGILPPSGVFVPSLPSCSPLAAFAALRCTNAPSAVWRPPSLG